MRTGRSKVGYEGAITASKFLELKKMFRRAEFVDVEKDLLLLRAVKTPQEIAKIAAAKPGITGKALDAVARRMITKAGYGKLFGHGLGHGVGLEVHEYPVASKRFNTVLKPGMFVTIEPGIYIEGELGVRIEDLVLITKDGCEVISQSPR